METCFTNLEPCDITKATETLLMLEQHSWNTVRYKKAKLRYYDMFKSDLCQEEYIPPLIYRNMYEMCIKLCQSRDCNLVESQILLVETPIGVSTSRVPDWDFYW